MYDCVYTVQYPLNNIMSVNGICQSQVYYIGNSECTRTIMLSFSMTSFKVVPYMWHLVFYVQQTQPLKYMCILELSNTSIWPNQMTTKWYIHSYHMIIESFKAILHIMDVMGLVVTYVELTFFQYYTFLFIVIWPMSICDMDHYAHLLWVIVLNLYFILWL